MKRYYRPNWKLTHIGSALTTLHDITGGNIATIETRMIGFEWCIHKLNNDNTYTGITLASGISLNMRDSQIEAQEALLALGIEQLPENLTSML